MLGPLRDSRKRQDLHGCLTHRRSWVQTPAEPHTRWRLLWEPCKDLHCDFPHCGPKNELICLRNTKKLFLLKWLFLCVDFLIRQRCLLYCILKCETFHVLTGCMSIWCVPGLRVTNYTNKNAWIRASLTRNCKKISNHANDSLDTSSVFQAVWQN